MKKYFVDRIRKLVRKAGYKTEAERSEVSLNAFLNGLNAKLRDELLAVEGVEDSFEKAVKLSLIHI